VRELYNCESVFFQEKLNLPSDSTGSNYNVVERHTLNRKGSADNRKFCLLLQHRWLECESHGQSWQRQTKKLVHNFTYQQNRPGTHGPQAISDISYMIFAQYAIMV